MRLMILFTLTLFTSLQSALMTLRLHAMRIPSISAPGNALSMVTTMPPWLKLAQYQQSGTARPIKHDSIPDDLAGLFAILTLRFVIKL